MEFLIYSPKSNMVQEGIINSLDLEAPARNDGCPQGKVHPGRCPQPPSRNQSPCPLNAQHLPDSVLYLVFLAAAYVSYPPMRSQAPDISNCAPSRLRRDLRYVLSGWTRGLLLFSTKCLTSSCWEDLLGFVLLKCTEALLLWSSCK